MLLRHFWITSLVFTMEDSLSENEIFLMQNTFNENSLYAGTQDASNAVNFFEDEYLNDIDDHAFHEDVVFGDFSDQPDNSSVAPSTQQIVQMYSETPKLSTPMVPMVSEEYFGDGEKVCT